MNVVVENSPDLKAERVYVQAMEGIDKCENNVHQSRLVFNDTVTKRNGIVQQFPSSAVAGIFGFRQEAHFESSSDKGNVPE